MADGAYRSIFLFTSLATRYLLSCRRGRAPAPPSYRRHASLGGAPAPGPRTPWCENKKPFSPTRAVTRGGRKGSRRSAVPPRLRARRPDRFGPGGILTRDPHTASVMRSHCATGPLTLHSSTPLTRRQVGEG